VMTFRPRLKLTGMGFRVASCPAPHTPASLPLT